MSKVTDSATNDQFDFFRRLGAGMQAIEREMWQGPWNDDPHGPYYKILCGQLHELEEKTELYDTLFSEFKRVEGLLADSRKIAASTDVDNIMATPARTRQYVALTIERMSELEAQVAELKKDAERMDWLDRVMFEGKWDGTIGRPKSWHMAGPYRHELMKMRGASLREAIDAAKESGVSP